MTGRREGRGRRGVGVFGGPLGLLLGSLVACAGAPASKPPVSEPPWTPIAPVPVETSTDEATPSPSPATSVDSASKIPPPFAGPVPLEGPHHTPPTLEAAPAALAVKWKTRVGRTTFRTTMALVDRQLVIGTHGDTLAGQNEASDGVYVLDAATGKLTRKIATPGTGDKDVGGIAIDGHFVVFGTDNGQIVRARIDDGTIVWKVAAGGKVRAAPALADLDGVGARDVVVGDEQGTLFALSGDTGQPLWTKTTGVNEYDAKGFVAGAAIVDIDGDGKDDVVAGARDGALVAYRGSNGAELWRVPGESGIHATPSVVDLDGDGRFEILAAWSYSRVEILDAPTGTSRYQVDLALDRGGIEGLFGSPVPLPVNGGAGLLVQGTSWWGGKRSATRTQELVVGVDLAGQERLAFRSDEGRVSATPVVMDLGDDQMWDAIVGTETGELLALRADGTRTSLGKFGPIEAPALIADVDGDGTYEILVASNDGMLTCLSTGSRTKPLVPRFRGETPDNRGLLGAIPLGWHTQSARPVRHVRRRKR